MLQVLKEMRVKGALVEHKEVRGQTGWCACGLCPHLKMQSNGSRLQGWRQRVLGLIAAPSGPVRTAGSSSMCTVTAVQSRACGNIRSHQAHTHTHTHTC